MDYHEDVKESPWTELPLSVMTLTTADLSPPQHHDDDDEDNDIDDNDGGDSQCRHRRCKKQHEHDAADKITDDSSSDSSFWMNTILGTDQSSVISTSSRSRSCLGSETQATPPRPNVDALHGPANVMTAIMSDAPSHQYHAAENIILQPHPSMSTTDASHEYDHDDPWTHNRPYEHEKQEEVSASIIDQCPSMDEILQATTTAINTTTTPLHALYTHEENELMQLIG
jgi:hypothetical protein